MFWHKAQMEGDYYRRIITDQFVFFDEAAKLSARNQFAPLPQDQLGTEDNADGNRNIRQAATRGKWGGRDHNISQIKQQRKKKQKFLQ